MVKQIIFLSFALLVIVGLLIGFSLKEKKQISSLTISPTVTLFLSKSQAINDTDMPLTLPEGFHIRIFADHLNDARDIEISPEGILLVSQPKQGTVVALIKKENSSTVDKKIVASNLNNPHGLAFYKGTLYITEETKVSRYKWDGQKVEATFDKMLFKLPQGGRHNTRTIVFNNSGEMYISIGSTCDVCNETDPISTIIQSDANGTNPRVYATGLRNAPFIAINTSTQELWATEMGRDYLGDDAPPDEIDIIKQGKNYGWPICYGDKIHDTNFDKKKYLVDPCQNTVGPVYDIQAHSAPLGLAFIKSSQFPKDWQGDLLVAYHGSWNRTVPTGYKIVHMKIQNNVVTNVSDFISGFITDGKVLGRPVDVAFDQKGNLYISDDKTGNIYIVTSL